MGALARDPLAVVGLLGCTEPNGSESVLADDRVPPPEFTELRAVETLGEPRIEGAFTTKGRTVRS